MKELYFPSYSYKSFEEKDLRFIHSDTLENLNRYDYINLTRLNLKNKQKMLQDLLHDYLEAAGREYDYKDYIISRYFYKQFVIRENTDEGNQVRYYKYTLSDWDESAKDVGLDNRILTIEIYTKDTSTNKCVRDVTYKLMVGHKLNILDQINKVIDALDAGEVITSKKINLYVIPLFFSIYPLNSLDNIGSIPFNSFTYERISQIKHYPDSLMKQILLFLPQSLYRFCIFNYYMLNRVEDNVEMIFLNSNNNFELDTLVSYIKRHPKEDKHVVIRDFKYNLSIKMDPSRSNIYSHDNVIIRTLCDYRHQVHAHYQHYWKGSKKDGTRHRELIWKESYERNKDKPYRVIKEHEKDAENDNQKFE